MRAVKILIAAALLGMAGGYGWSAMVRPTTAAAATAAKPRSAHAAKPHKLVQPQDQVSLEDREWAARGDDNRGPRPIGPGHNVYYPNCAAARAAGAAPIYAGQPGYRPELDGDSDGIACEPYHGTRN